MFPLSLSIFKFFDLNIKNSFNDFLIFVSSPCPGCTIVFSERFNNLFSMLSISILKLSEFCVLPGPPGNKVSPENKLSSINMQVEPCVCPGVLINFIIV